MSRRKISLLIVAALVSGLFVAIVGTATAHECWDADDPPPDYEENAAHYWEDGDQICRDTWIVPNWRENYVPLFDLENRHDPEQRKDAQRWRDECNPSHNDYHQMCTWSYGGFSLFENRDDDNTAPNEWHVGFAANHCFLFEAAHQCEDHHTSYGEGVHDTHGGSIYVDLCLTENPESRYCRDGLEDTQVGINAVDHLGCAPAGCLDEYHLVRPLDPAHTQRQMENSQRDIVENLAEPGRWFCGHHASGRDCREALKPLTEVTYPLLGAAVGYQPDRSDLRRACPNSPEAGFVDIAGNVHAGAIDCAAWWLLTNGGPGGLPADHYGPRLEMTRAQLASVLYLVIDRSEGNALPAWDGRNRFADVNSSNPHLVAINRLAEAGIVHGVSGGRFNPHGTVRKSQLASFLARTIGFVTDHPRASDSDRFGDVHADNPHRQSINAMWESGIVIGVDGEFRPHGVVSRGVLASTVMRVIDLHVEEGYANPPSSRYGAVHSHDHHGGH